MIDQKRLAAFAAGLLFAEGLIIGGMANPAKVLGFLDFAGDWDPSLMFVMGGALVVYAVLYRIITRRKLSWVGMFHLPTRRDIDGRLVAGAVLFGLGWGLVGFCPGPAVVSLASLRLSAVVVAGWMFAGMALFHLWQHRANAARR